MSMTTPNRGAIVSARQLLFLGVVAVVFLAPYRSRAREQVFPEDPLPGSTGQFICNVLVQHVVVPLGGSCAPRRRPRVPLGSARGHALDALIHSGLRLGVVQLRGEMAKLPGSSGKGAKA